MAEDTPMRQKYGTKNVVFSDIGLSLMAILAGDHH